MRLAGFVTSHKSGMMCECGNGEMRLSVDFAGHITHYCAYCSRNYCPTERRSWWGREGEDTSEALKPRKERVKDDSLRDFIP